MAAINLGVPRQKGHDWRDDAACLTTDPDMFFADDMHTVMRAKEFCNTQCGVRDQCATYAMEADEHHGVWGGLSRPDRIRLRKKRAS
jgi:WhiB family redox-sensing transcriptional regulator